MNRQQRAEIAQETLAILETGRYRHESGTEVDLNAALSKARAASVLYRPDDITAIHAGAEARPARAGTTIGVSNRTTLAAARALVREHASVACLNFASARNPGGGFISGSQAQEESLARGTGLYATLMEHGEFYEYHRARKSGLYSDHAIYSPGVPVFRDDADRLLETPWSADFITAAAVNAGAIRQNEPQRVGEIEPAMESRARMVLSIAAAHGCDALVLGAWGCGVFQNSPALVASVFARALEEPAVRGRFSHVEFAIFDTAAGEPSVIAFRNQFG